LVSVVPQEQIAEIVKHYAIWRLTEK
jgi:hypothetical protein